MSRRQPDAFAKSLYAGKTKADGTRRARWRRTGLPITVAIAIVVVAAVITDLPAHESLAGELSAGSALLKEVNNDVSPCSFSLNETNTIYRDQLAGKLSASDHSRVPSLLQDDAAACSFTSDNINDLADIEEPGTGAGKYLSQVVSLTQTWTTSDALGAINDIIILVATPGNKAAETDLRTRQAFLISDRRAAMAAMADADHYLKGSLPALEMPAVTLPVSTEAT